MLLVTLNALMGFPPVDVGLLVYLLLSRAGPLGELGLLFTPTAMSSLHHLDSSGRRHRSGTSMSYDIQYAVRNAPTVL